MLDIGFSEILLTSVIALVVLGPERLPKVAKQVGNWIGRARAMARQLSDQLDREVAAADITKFETKTAPGPVVQPPPEGEPLSFQPQPPSADEPPFPAQPVPAVNPAETTESSKTPHE